MKLILAGGRLSRRAKRADFFWDYLPWFLDFIAFETYCMVVSVILFYNVTGTVQIANHNFVKNSVSFSVCQVMVLNLPLAQLLFLNYITISNLDLNHFQFTLK